jgi:RNA polymerase sigma factor (sigma-70 family)
VARRDPTSAFRTLTARGPQPGWSDSDLVQACLEGSDEAWSALIEKYKDLIYAIPRRYGASPEDAADIFQSVCVDLFSELPRLQKTEALRAWLITVTAHKAYHWKRKSRKLAEREGTPVDEEQQQLINPVQPSDPIEDIERMQMLREAIAQLPPRCQEMIRLFFFRDPPAPYQEVARSLGLQVGSIGFIRGRCLQRLQKALVKMGF